MAPRQRPQLPKILSGDPDSVNIPVKNALMLLDSLVRAQQSLKQAKIATEAMSHQLEMEGQVVERARQVLQKILRDSGPGVVEGS